MRTDRVRLQRPLLSGSRGAPYWGLCSVARTRVAVAATPAALAAALPAAAGAALPLPLPLALPLAVSLALPLAVSLALSTSLALPSFSLSASLALSALARLRAVAADVTRLRIKEREGGWFFRARSQYAVCI